jgi:lysine biosynthesis protein LysW
MQSDSTECPECQSTIPFKKPPHLRQRVECRHCEAMLIVVSRQPLQLDLDYSETRSRAARRKSGRNRDSTDGGSRY